MDGQWLGAGKESMEVPGKTRGLGSEGGLCRLRVWPTCTRSARLSEALQERSCGRGCVHTDRHRCVVSGKQPLQKPISSSVWWE